MNSRKQMISRQFNRSAAGSYDRHANVQRTMADQLSQSLLHEFSPKADAALNILEIGCGTGALTERLANDWPDAIITALDLAPEMINAAKHRIGIVSKGSNIRFLSADIEEWAPIAASGSFDFIVANACFQWLSHPVDTLLHLRRLLRSEGEGMLAFATFGPDTFHELHESFKAVYLASGKVPQRHGLSFKSTSEWKYLLEQAGFTSVQVARSIQTEVFVSPSEFLHAVKAVGASTSEAAVTPGISSRSLITGMYKEYKNKFSIPAGIGATYELLFIQALAAR
ncbi:malonyl-ACP O-methyltransferase BioC [Paenibacillus sp. FJAT-27812]|uniref:malonyl-ACP O-methyltransferase BioC n=1 Tax=Paenibacillus sp. FJAT-27812 TaxID=1684143 RepID=UPI0006A7C983|nr:malonyl-ACP O-methyltransferase BioC [Paenibacillus sp. FJAT-27812]